MRRGTRLTLNHLRNMLQQSRVAPCDGLIGTFMARDALSLAATYVELKRDDIVLLPAYLCKEVLRPFACRSRLQFYDVDDTLRADPDVIKRFLKHGQVRLLVIINYFGFLQRRQEIARLCAEYQTVLLEDCAHSFLTSGSGECGDLSVVSYRKLLPVFDGGALKIRRSAAAFTVLYYAQLYSNVLSLLAMGKSFAHFQSDALSRGGMADRRQTWRAFEIDGRSRKVLPLSWFARNGAANASVEQIVERRRHDYEFWQRLVTGSSVMRPLMGRIDDGVCPLGFPVTAQNRDDVSADLKRLGVPVKVQWTLSPDIGKACANSHRLSRQMMSLPVYPDLTARIKERVDSALRRGRQQ
jgi:perosamine synthetase